MIFVTNDDGIDAPGLKVLAEALETLDEVYVVAPESGTECRRHGDYASSATQSQTGLDSRLCS